MPSVQGDRPGNLSECLCAFADRLGSSKQVVIDSINSVVGLLRVANAYYRLVNITIEDDLKKARLELELAWLQNGTEYLSTYPKLFASFARPYSDCPPVATLMKTMKKSIDDKMKPVYERQFEIERMISAINRKKRKASVIDGWIEWLEAIVEALQACGES